MSDEENDENQVAIPTGKPFEMPDFTGRVDHLKNELANLNKEAEPSVIAHVSKEITKMMRKLTSKISDGDKEILQDQKDIDKINKHIHAVDKKSEFKRKIRHMGIHEGVLRGKEMDRKLKLLDENIRYLEDDISDGDKKEGEGEGDDNDGDETRNQLKQHNHSRRSVDAIKRLEDKLGLPISTKNARIKNYKEHMHVNKDEFTKSQQSAEVFINKMKEKERELKQKRKSRKQREQRKMNSMVERNKEKSNKLMEEKKEKLLERIEHHKEMLEKEKEIRHEREKNWKKFKQMEK